MQSNPHRLEGRPHARRIGTKFSHGVDPSVVLIRCGRDIPLPTVAEKENVGRTGLRKLTDETLAHRAIATVGIVPTFRTVFVEGDDGVGGMSNRALMKGHG